MKRKKILSILLLAVTTILLLSCSTSTEDVLSELKADNYKKAVQNYSKLPDKDKSNIEKDFIEEAEIIKQRYIDGEIDNVTAINALTEIKLVNGAEEMATNAMTIVNKIEKSRTAFNNGEIAFNNGEWEKALKEYTNVIAEDIKNYDVAKAKIGEATKKIQDSILVVVDSVNIIVQHDQWKALYPDMIKIILNNKSDQAIKNIEIGFLAWDSNNFPIKIKPQYSFGNEKFEFIGIGENVNIIGNSIWDVDRGWNLDENHGITTLKANVKKVEFYNGTTWTNPLYDTWIQEYKEKPLQ